MDRKLRERWETPEGRLLAEEVVARLVSGRPLSDLALPDIGGHSDLRSLPAPAPRRLARFERAGWFIEELGDLVKLRGRELRSLDLSGAFLDSFRFWNCVIEDCVFEGARCQDWRMWESSVRDTSFRGADLRRSVLGPWKLGKGNEFSGVDFTKADLRNGPSVTAVFTECDFSGAKLDKMRFLRSGLARCRFGGVMKEVQFEGRVTDPDAHEPNYCKDVDMSKAVLRLVEFLGFDLTGVKLPPEPGLRVIQNYPCVVASAIKSLSSREDETARVLRAVLEEPGLERGRPLGLFNRDDYVLLGGEELAALADNVIQQAERDCSIASESKRH
jgi:uncharacterized protein YjbI with pentapeptide repeats